MKTAIVVEIVTALLVLMANASSARKVTWQTGAAVLGEEEGSGAVHDPLAELLEKLDDEDEGSGEYSDLLPVIDDEDEDEMRDYDIRMQKLDQWDENMNNKEDEKEEDYNDWYEYDDDSLYPTGDDGRQNELDDDAYDSFDYDEKIFGRVKEVPATVSESPSSSDVDAANIEIKPRPANDSDLRLSTAQIFIMAGSAAVSFVIVMLSFFMCRRTMANKKAKTAAAANKNSVFKTATIRPEASIVKDYQKVPTSTLEILHQESTIRKDPLAPIMEPLVK